ncbi:hypothetical protein Q5P01_008226 [Channa striata]|uniref:Uncharacterized protein n=1 Tax=Channa striata TaxID=64152 RepID=A0AA88SVJ9_CHASR|nr:hypothetical protein Q5P01_008226 [Channa striata]
MYDNVRESSRVYDEIGDPVEMSTVYTLISPNGVKPTDEYSLATGTCAQNQFSNYKSCRPVSTCQDSTYQSLSPVTRDQDQIYSTLTEKQQQ